MQSNELLASLDRFAEVTVSVVGDVMLDTYWFGSASRLSPEAPVPVVNLEKTRDIPGAAANVAANIRGLGAAVTLVGMIGTDEAGRRLCQELESLQTCSEFMIRSSDRRTISKTRVLAHKQQVVRIDDEEKHDANQKDEAAVVAQAVRSLKNANVVVLSDYAKGCLTRKVIESVVGEAKRVGIPTIVDPKGRDFAKYNGATLLTPNLSELMAAANVDFVDDGSIDTAADKILSETEIDKLLVTLGERGMRLFSRDTKPVHFDSVARDVFDVTGAGDTVAAILATAVGSKARLETAISLANIAAGVVVGKIGTATVTVDELRTAIHDESQ